MDNKFKVNDRVSSEILARFCSLFGEGIGLDCWVKFLRKGEVYKFLAWFLSKSALQIQLKIGFYERIGPKFALIQCIIFKVNVWIIIFWIIIFSCLLLVMQIALFIGIFRDFLVNGGCVGNRSKIAIVKPCFCLEQPPAENL